ncbi:hypothetical protein [Acidaminococcus massiliensis]|uniref:hypothetical protein n=1 Tax=Acidaminococcus massiliensis TaxID=1852375 RepID=UPI0022E3F01A|nr:hypothetical protein [Acidaminococcus massiliensis]
MSDFLIALFSLIGFVKVISFFCNRVARYLDRKEADREIRENELGDIYDKLKQIESLCQEIRKYQ